MSQILSKILYKTVLLLIDVSVVVIVVVSLLLPLSPALTVPSVIISLPAFLHIPPSIATLTIRSPCISR